MSSASSGGSVEVRPLSGSLRFAARYTVGIWKSSAPSSTARVDQHGDTGSTQQPAVYFEVDERAGRRRARQRRPVSGPRRAGFILCAGARSCPIPGTTPNYSAADIERALPSDSTRATTLRAEYATFFVEWNEKQEAKRNVLKLAMKEAEGVLYGLLGSLKADLANASWDEEQDVVAWLTRHAVVCRPPGEQSSDYYTCRFEFDDCHDVRKTHTPSSICQEDHPYSAALPHVWDCMWQIIIGSQEQHPTPSEAYNIVLARLEKLKSSRMGIKKIYIGIAICFAARRATYLQHRTIFNHMEGLIRVSHAGGKAGEAIKAFEDAGIDAARELMPSACVAPFHNKVRSAGGRDLQFSYVLYVQTQDGGAA
jgi:hypothetical protein